MKFEDLSPEKLTLGELFSYKGKYIVPGYQRPYEWDAKQVESFLNTICNAFDLNPNESLLFGTVQFNLVNNKRIEMDREIIDGHQRFTTFYLLMKYIGIQIDIQYENDILNTSSIDDLLAENTPNNLYKKNYKYIEEHIGKYKNNEKFKNFVKEKIILISIEISNCTSIDDTLQVFNSLNTTGLQLQVKDIFKIQYCDYLSRFTNISKETILSKINNSYNEININGDKIYSLNESVLLDVFKFYIMGKSKGKNWATNFRLSNSKFFENIFKDDKFNENLNIDVFIDISHCLKCTQNILKEERDIASVDGVNGFAKELIDWSGYGKLKNLYYYLIYIQYINDKQVDFNKIKKAESFTVELVKFCSFFRFTHSKIINSVFNDVGELVFNKFNSKENSSRFNLEYIETAKKLKKEAPDRMKMFTTLFEGNGNVFNSNKPHLLLALSYIDDSIKSSYNISIKKVKEDLFYREKWDIDIEHILSRSIYENDKYVNSIGNLMYLSSNINKSLGVFTKKNLKNDNAKQLDFNNKLGKYKSDNLLSVKEFLNEYGNIDFIQNRNDEKIKFLKEFFNYNKIYE